MGKKEKKDEHSGLMEELKERQNEAKVVRKVVAIITVSILLIAIIVFGGGFLYINSALKPVDPDSKIEKKIEIPIGSGVSTISQILEDNGIIKDARVFKYYVKFKNESGFMAGEYVMNPTMTLPQIVNSLKTGKVMQKAVFKITIPEGKKLTEIAEIIAKSTNHKPEEILTALNDQTFIESLISQYPELLTNEVLNPLVKYPLEGYLYPATYPFYKEDPSIEDIAKVMLNKTKSVVDEYRIQIEEKQMTVHQLLTMASLIEEEATEKVDRNQISSVFYNRIDAGMPLQTDPTVLYAKGEHKEKVYYKDLEIEDPYNTYMNPGLTPGPIANAGLSSIEAALEPAETDFLYFLATPEGEVLFSKTLAEHNEKKAEHIQ
ncbi:endolytic transglycosylase MltG [Niallia endozanthoxylica]|uniref:Endolytic murein transglycosylase n=1 Tax=Niallia endozanthoxylica TaxID=2036016 RepID=A0A5J5HV23_9BACI|nr:endolytic transglycosylase MltG [Niallia endozanthoxylica]KAA9026396.1 endolytic transglycosylase MltG [Niallia endozanthoxylica]